MRRDWDPLGNGGNPSPRSATVPRRRAPFPPLCLSAGLPLPRPRLAPCLQVPRLKISPAPARRRAFCLSVGFTAGRAVSRSYQPSAPRAGLTAGAGDRVFASLIRRLIIRSCQICKSSARSLSLGQVGTGSASGGGAPVARNPSYLDPVVPYQYTCHLPLLYISPCAGDVEYAISGRSRV